MYGLGKKRSLLGEFLDKNGLSQEWLAKELKISRNSISAICDGKKNVIPRVGTQQAIISFLRKKGFDVIASDFWPNH